LFSSVYADDLYNCMSKVWLDLVSLLQSSNANVPNE